MKFLHHLRACIVEYVSEYIFFVSNKKTHTHTHTQKAKESKENRKTKDTKEEKEKENVTKICGKTNFVH